MKKKWNLCLILLCIILAGCAKKETTADETTVTEVQTDTSVEETTSESVQETDVLEETSNDILETTGIGKFELTSADLQDGVWNTVITETADGSNISPQLSWEAVEGAECYAIYMTDTSAGNFIHWKAANVAETNLPQGWATSDYIGPYPPPGATHNYDIYVIALKKPVERAKGAVKSSNPNFADHVMALDTDVDGATGNMIAYGYLTGTFTAE